MSFIFQTNRERAIVLDSTEYELAIQLLNRQNPIPMKHRERLQQKVYVKISRYHLTASHIYDPFLEKVVERLLKNKRIVLPEKEIGACIDKLYKCSKGEGARKLNDRIKSHFYGIGTKTIQKRLNRSKRQQKQNPKFLNKAPLGTISAKRKMERHQIDLVDLSKIAVTIDEIEYNYVLAVMDIFSRFLWLRPLSDKSADQVATELKKLYSIIGYPHLLQTDRGGEFFGSLKRFCEQRQVTLIHSGAYHPQSQGKIERSHATWKSKLRYDIADGDLNWVRNLDSYQELYNSGLQTAIGMTPYECFVGSKPNRVDDPTQAEVEKRQAEAFENNYRAAEKMKQRFSSKHPPSLYKIGEQVYVRRGPKGKIGKQPLSLPNRD